MSNNNEKIKDLFIRIVLIIIIIILLFYNFYILKKHRDDLKPTGNINIIEIKCNKDDFCEIHGNNGSEDSGNTEKPNSGSVTKPEGSKKTISSDKKDDSSSKKDDKDDTKGNAIAPIINPINPEKEQDKSDGKTDNSKTDNKSDDNKTDNETNNGSNNDDSNNNSENNNGENNNDDSGDDNENTDTPDIPEEFESEELIVRDKNVTWSDITEAKIFSSSMYELGDKIAPESFNTYKFAVKNGTYYNLKYEIKFIESNPYNINMKYKLKKNDTYIVDHYVSADELNISDMLLDARTSDTYYLEWKWISSSNDTEIGSNLNSTYDLQIQVNAESYDD